MAHLHKKIKKGRPYYYLREIQRVAGKPKVVSQIYLGSPETIGKRLREADEVRRPVRLQTHEFGSLFILHELEKKLDTIGIVDSIIPPAAREKGPSIGEYFFYAWLNRLIAPRSKKALGEWYRKTAIQQIRPVSIKELTSQRYWEKWDRLQAEDVERIGQTFFEKLWQFQPLSPECLLFDTTNYYTFMASKTESDLCQRGNNKASKHHLRQIGLALLVDRSTHLPLFYRIYEGNTHDAKLFRQVIDDMFGIMCRFNQSKQRLTVVFDKGMNSEETFHHIDDNTRIHFITTYSPYFVEELVTTALRKFSPVAIKKNQLLDEKGKSEDKVLAYRTRSDLWGKERTVIATYNPRTARKKLLRLERKLETVRQALLEFRGKYRERRVQWRETEKIKERYFRLCEKLHIGSQYYQLEFGDLRRAPDMIFRKDHYQREKTKTMLGKNIIVTDNHDWTTEEIVQASLDRWGIEKQFRSSKSCHHVRINPLFHWTDSKIRCQLLTCVISLSILQLMEMTVNQALARTSNGAISGLEILEEMHHLHSSWLWYPGKRKPEHVIEEPTKTQAEVLKAFGWAVDRGGVLQMTGG